VTHAIRLFHLHCIYVYSVLLTRTCSNPLPLLLLGHSQWGPHTNDSRTLHATRKFRIISPKSFFSPSTPSRCERCPAPIAARIRSAVPALLTACPLLEKPCCRSCAASDIPQALLHHSIVVIHLLAHCLQRSLRVFARCSRTPLNNLLSSKLLRPPTLHPQCQRPSVGPRSYRAARHATANGRLKMSHYDRLATRNWLCRL